MKKIIVFIVLSIFANTVFGQGYFNNWFFGNGAGLNFNAGTPIAINGNVNTVEGSAAISDNLGNLLFYTDGVTIWDANNAVMTNGTGLLGNASSTQSALILLNPANQNQYYVFTAPLSGSITYSIVDMTLAGGLGAVTSTKNVVMHPSSTERVTAVCNSTKSGYWILGHELGTSAFFAYELTSAGLTTTPVLSSVGSVHAAAIGYLKANHAGNKLAIAMRDVSKFELFDFDNSTGIISNAIIFPTTYVSSYGVEFSPDDSRLYLSGGLSFAYIYQVDMTAGSSAAIINSSTLIATPVISGAMGALLLGPDSKIYAAKYGTTNLGVINNPNALGAACNYVDNQVLLTSAVCQAGLPNNYKICCSLPFVNLGNDTSFCQGQSVTLNAGSASSFLWSDGTTDSSIIATTSGTYWVQTSDGSCSQSDTINIIFNAIPIVNLGNDTTYCQGQTVTLNAGSANSFLWSNGSTDSSITASITGNYWVQASNGQCASSDSINIIFNAVPFINLGNDTSLCQGQSITLNGGLATSFLWSDGTTDSTFTTSTSGTIWVQISNGQCSNSDTININFIAAPTVNLGNDSTLCQGQTITLNAGSANSFLWSNGSTNSSITTSTAGLYWVQASNGQCATSDTININFNTFPIVNIGNDTTLCQGQTVTLNAGSANSYLWSDGTTNSSIIASTTGNYWVQANNGICASFDTININFIAVPTVNLGNDSTYCQGQTITLNAGSANSFLWSDGSTVSSITVSTSGNYWVQSSNGQCTASDTINIIFNTFPTVNLGNDTTLCIGQTVTLNAGSANSFLWSDGTANSSLIASTTGNYWVQASNGDCATSDSLTITNTDCEISIEIPNVITPNNDGFNDHFVPIKYIGISSAILKIFNRWGKEIFSTDNLLVGWDGYYKNELCTDGTYYWIVQYMTINSESKELKGFLSLMK